MTESNGSAVNKVIGGKGDEEAALCLGESKKSNDSVSSKGPKKSCNQEVKASY